MDLDPRLSKYGVKVVSTTNAAWVLLSAKCREDSEPGVTHNVYFTVLDAKGHPKPGVTCVVTFPHTDPNDPQDVDWRGVTDANGQVNFPMYANLDIHELNGPYVAYIEDESKSDVVRGMGLPESHLIDFFLTFGPKTQPPSLEETIRAEAQRLHWMPINTKAALYMFAQAHRLEYPQTDEFRVTYEDTVYVAQVFNKGIVYTKDGDWDPAHIGWVPKPGQ